MRTTFNLPPEIRAYLEEGDGTMTEALRKAVLLHKYLSEQQKAGRQIIVVDPISENRSELILL